MSGFPAAGTVRRMRALTGAIRTTIITRMAGTTTKAIGTMRTTATIMTTTIGSKTGSTIGGKA